MIKLAILGVENSHSRCFASVLSPRDGEKIFNDVELIGVYGDPNEDGFTEGVEDMERVSTCPVYSDDYNRFLDEADAVMVTARHGANHLKYAQKYIEKGIPVWIDKPFTCDVKEVDQMVSLAEKSGCILCGGSSLEHVAPVKKFEQLVKEKNGEICGGHVTAPVNMKNAYGDFWFYTQHLVAMIMTVFGYDIKKVMAKKDKNGVHAIYSYDNFSVSAYFGAGYSVSVYTDGMDAVSEAFPLPEDYYMPELKAFYEVLKTGKADKTKKQIIAPVYVLDATIRSYTENQEITLNY